MQETGVVKLLLLALILTRFLCLKRAYGKDNIRRNLWFEQRDTILEDFQARNSHSLRKENDSNSLNYEVTEAVSTALGIR